MDVCICTCALASRRFDCHVPTCPCISWSKRCDLRVPGSCLCHAGGVWLSASDAADCLSLICHCPCAGKHTSREGEADCVACGAGKYAASPLSATACVDCAAGKHLASTGNDAETDCVECAAGADACPAVL